MKYAIYPLWVIANIGLICILFFFTSWQSLKIGHAAFKQNFFEDFGGVSWRLLSWREFTRDD